MTDREFVQSIWDAVSDVLATEGFALGGGLAMRAHGIIDRETQDIDAFRRDPLLTEPEAFDRAERGITQTLTQHGFVVDSLYHQDFGRKLEVLDAVTGRSTTIDLGRDSFPKSFVKIEGYGIVINRDDMAGMKMRALWERHAERDYVDYDAMRRSGLWSADDLVRLLDATGSIVPPNDGNWYAGLASTLGAAQEDADKLLLEDMGVSDVDGLCARLSLYSKEHSEHQARTQGQSVRSAQAPESGALSNISTPSVPTIGAPPAPGTASGWPTPGASASTHMMR